MQGSPEALSRFISRMGSDRKFLDKVRKAPHREAERYGLTTDELELALEGDVPKLVAYGVAADVFEHPKPRSFWMAPALMRMGGLAAALLLSLSFVAAAPDNRGAPGARMAIRRAGADGRWVVHPTTARAARARAGRASQRARYFVSPSWEGRALGRIVGGRRAGRQVPFGSYSSQDDAITALKTVWEDIELVSPEKQIPQ